MTKIFLFFPKGLCPGRKRETITRTKQLHTF
jgi:hypothetical protein